MTQKTQLSTSEQFYIHIMEGSQYMMERLDDINITPHSILNISHSDLDLLLHNKFPKAIIYNSSLLETEHCKVDMVFAICHFQPQEFFDAFPASVVLWKDVLKPGGLLMLGIINPSGDIFEVGDFLSQLNFKNIVVDKEVLVEVKSESDEKEIFFVHGWKAKPVSIPINQIR